MLHPFSITVSIVRTCTFVKILIDGINVMYIEPSDELSMTTFSISF